MQNLKDVEQKEESVQPSNALKVVKDTKHELEGYRLEFQKMWKMYDDAYYGKQHKTGEGIKTVKNHIFKIIEGEVPVLTDSMPSSTFTASKQERQNAADSLGKALKYVYQDQNLTLLLPTLVRSSLMSGPGYLYIKYNQDADEGEGKIEFKQLPWTSVYLDGNASTIEQSEKCRIEIPMRREAAARMWPEFEKELLKLNGNEVPINDDANFEKRDVSGRVSELGKPKPYRAKDVIIYAETWVKDYSLEDIEPEETASEIQEENSMLGQGQPADTSKWQNHAEHKNGHLQLRGQLLSMIGLPADAPFEQVSQKVDELLAQNPQAEELRSGLLLIKIIDNHIDEHTELEKLNPTGQEPRYDDGWRVIKSFDSIVVYDGENPTDVPHIPLVPFYCYKDETIYGFGEIKNILNPQQTLNDMDFREFEGLRLCSNPGWVADHESEVDNESLTNAPGLVVKKKMGTEVRRLEGGTISPQLEQRKQLDKDAMGEIAGINEATNPITSQGQQSGVAIQKIQAQAIGRIRLKDRYLQHYSMRRLALITAEYILRYWTQERSFRLRGDDANIEEFVFNPLEMEDLEYSVEICPGSMAGIDKDALNAFYMLLLNNQHIDFETFLLVSDFPKKDIMLKRLQEQQQNQLVQAQQQMQQMQIQAEQQAQIQSQQVQALQDRNNVMKVENTTLKQVMSPHDKKIHLEMMRQMAKQNIENENELEDAGANQSQP